MAGRSTAHRTGRMDENLQMQKLPLTPLPQKPFFSVQTHQLIRRSPLAQYPKYPDFLTWQISS